MIDETLPPQGEDFPADAAPEGMPPPAAPADYESVDNLAEVLPAKWLEKTAKTVVENEAMDWKSSEKHRQGRVRHFDLFCGKVPERAANEKNILYVHLPYVAKAVILFHSKMHRNRFPANGDVCAVKIARPQERDRERRLSRHMNLAMRKLVPEYIDEHDSGGLQVLLYGDGFSVPYYDPIEKRTCFEFLASDDIVVPYTCKSKRVDMADVPRITWRKKKYRHELEAMADAGYYVNVDKLFPKEKNGEEPPAVEEEQEKRSGSVTEASDKITGVEASAEDANRPREILECDMWLKLPGEKRERPVTVCVDKQTKTVLRLTLREREDPKDLGRFRREEQAWNEAVAANEAVYAESVAGWQEAMTVREQEAMALQREFDAMAAAGVLPPPVSDDMLSPAPPEPQRPKDPPAPAPVRKVPFHRFSHYWCIPNPEGFYNFGIGFLAEGQNISANELISLTLSLLRMHLRPTGFFSRMAKTPRGEFDMTLGEMRESHLPPEQLQKAFFNFQFPAPDVTGAMKLEERLSRSVQEVTADEVIGGAPGLSGQTATETEIRTSNAMDNISVINARYDRARARELSVFAYIFSQTLPDDGYTFSDVQTQVMPPAAPGMPPQQTEQVDDYTVTRDDYLEDFEVVFVTDPNVSSQPQREARAMKLFQAVMQVTAAAPAGVPALDPVTAAMMVRAAAKEVVKAMEFPDIAQMLDSAPLPQIPAPMGLPAEGETNGEPGPQDEGGPPPGVEGAPADPGAEAAAA